MRTTCVFKAVIALCAAALMTDRGYSQEPPPAPTLPPGAPIQTEPVPPQDPETSNPVSTAPATPNASETIPSEAPLQFTPPPFRPPAPKVEKPKVQIDGRGRRIRKDKVTGKRSRSTTKVPATALSEETEFKLRSDVELVLLDVSVKDQRGGFVSGLSKDDFRILDNKTEQQITVFQAQDVPVTVGLVVDNSGSVRPKKDHIITAALTFVKNSNPQDEVFIVNFNDQVLKALPDGVDFTDDHALLRDGLLLNPAQGRTALYDGLQEALDHIEKGRLDKKTIVLIADGGDNMSETTEDEIIRRVEESLATIYTVGIYNPQDKDKNPGFLRRLAEISGGEYYQPRNISNLVGVCEKIAHDIRNRYTIGYAPQGIPFDGRVRKLRVTATNPSDGRQLQVRTRTEYQTPSIQSSDR